MIRLTTAMTAATPMTTPSRVRMLRSLCAHRLSVAIATASEKFIRRARVPAAEPAGAWSDEPARAFIATLGALAPADARTGREPGLDLSMDTYAGECPHPNIRMRGEDCYGWGRAEGDEKQSGRPKRWNARK